MATPGHNIKSLSRSSSTRNRKVGQEQGNKGTKTTVSYSSYGENRGSFGKRQGKRQYSVGNSQGMYRKPTHFYRLNFSEIVHLSQQSCDKVVTELGENKLKDFQQSLSTCRTIKDSSQQKYIEAVIAILKKVCMSKHDYFPNIILAEILTERCAEFHSLLSEYVKKLSILPLSVEEVVHDLCFIFDNMLKRLQMSSWSVLPIDDLADALTYIQVPQEILSEVLRLKELRNEIRDGIRKKQQSEQFNEDDDEWDHLSYRELSILPTIEEVCNSTSPKLQSNIINGSYTSWEHYYNIQFQLLREDFIAPLRRGISELKSIERSKRLTDIYIYHNVQLIKPLYTHNGVCYCMQFDISRLKQRRSWEHSKRLIFGSLLCFSPISDNFEEEIYFATVVDRDPADLAEGMVTVQFKDCPDMSPHLQSTHFTVVESKAYFEAYRHVLLSLQNAEVSTMPFSRYLIHNNSNSVRIPAYLKDDFVGYDLHWLYRYPSWRCQRHRSINILNEVEWPTEAVTELDTSQLEAMKMALTQEISVIQGPPGTGKTYIGYKIVQTLLQNRNVWDPNHTSPILVMCLTNHALDQFLEGIIHHKINNNQKHHTSRFPHVVRVGSRSQSKEIQELNINKVSRKVVPNHEFRLLRDIKFEIEEIIDDIKERYDLNKLKKVIHANHYYELEEVGNEAESLEHSLELWLGLLDSHTVGKDLNSIDDDDSRQEDVNYHEEMQKESQNAYDAIDHKVADDDNHSEYSTTEELIDIQGEAEIEELHRKIDDDYYHPIKIESVPGDSITNSAHTLTPNSQLQNKTATTFKYEQNSHKQLLNSPSLKYKLKTKKQIMDVEDLNELESISKLPMNQRWALYKLWIKQYQDSLIVKLEEKCEQYRQCQQHINRITLEKSEVIGMTTTGAAKYQQVLHLVKPKIVIVEEAAEVLESHIVSALNAGTQHLILIGDHKQLRPKLNEYDLAKNHHLDISLFERLIQNGMPHATLLIQHRMRPQIARLVCPHIYSKLINHDSVKKYHDIRSFDSNLFFFQHYEEEEKDSLLLSHSNEYEAQFVVALCRHLLKQGYQPSQVTILTAYTGQLLKVRQKMPKRGFYGVKVTNIDNFQGEENDIIILSLVRNNSLGNVGFLKEENRVCVALSRAKAGLYCFGNFEILRKSAPFWESIVSDVEREGCLGTKFLVHCQSHPDKKFSIEKPEDFANFLPTGGCKEPCLFRLECGHQCAYTCHVDNSNHRAIRCTKVCGKICKNDLHRCKAICHSSTCPPCKETVTKKVPNCGHMQYMPCSQDPHSHKCKVPCLRSCSDGHFCPLKCFQCHPEKCAPCNVQVVKTIPQCGHQQSMACHKNPSNQACLTKVEKIMPFCGHRQEMNCSVMVTEHNCQEQCRRVYECNHQCPKLCYEPCDSECNALVTKVLPQCGHEVRIKCLHLPSSFHCTKPCERALSCGHQCRQKCGSECDSSKCEEVIPYELPCGHTIDRDVLCKERLHINIKLEMRLCKGACKKILPCGHNCKKKCSESCTACNVLVSTTCSKGSHKATAHCHKVTSKSAQCMHRCLQKLPCGHACTKKCYEECECREMLKKKCKCGHIHSFKCGSSECTCSKKCTYELSCGHKCPGKCGDCFTTRVHAPCKYDVQIKRFCGHESKVPCYGLLDKCSEQCQMALCIHGDGTCDLSHPCWTICDIDAPCTRECCNKCPHIKCTLPCSEVCDVPSCGEHCTKTLKCKHYCPGLCGERCITAACMTCNRKKFIDKGSLSKGKNFNPEEHHYVQLECGHFFIVDTLDKKLGMTASETQLVFPPLCPICHKPVASTVRYRRLWLEQSECIKKVKLCLYSVETLSDQDDVNFNKNYIECKEIVMHQFPVGYMYRLNLPTNQEAACAMELFITANKLKNNASCLAPIAEKLLYKIANVLLDWNGNLSKQIITDIQSELFRISLLIFVQKIDKFKESIPMQKIGTVNNYLEQMDQDYNYRMTHKEYQKCLHHLQQCCQQASIQGEEFQSLIVQPANPPQSTKGEWYKCTAGHVYFVAAKYSTTKTISVCPDCASQSLGQKQKHDYSTCTLSDKSSSDLPLSS